MENTRLVSQSLSKMHLWVLALVISFVFLVLHILDITEVFNSSPIVFSSLWFITWGSLLFYFICIHKVTHTGSSVKKGITSGMVGIVMYILSDIWLIIINIQLQDADSYDFIILHPYVFGGFRALSDILFIICFFCLTKAFRRKTLQKSISLALALCCIVNLCLNIYFIIDHHAGLLGIIILYSLFYLCLIAFIIATSLPAFVEWLASEDSISPEPKPIVHTNNATDYKPYHVFPNGFVAGAALVLSLILGVLVASIRFETSRYIGFAFSPIPAVIVAAIISILMLILTFRNRKAQIALGIKKSIGGALICHSITLCIFWLCMITAIVLTASSSFRDIDDLYAPNILIIVGVVFLLFSIIFGFASSTKPADKVSVLALMPLLGLSMLSDIIASLINGHPTPFSFADADVYKISFFLFTIFSIIAAIIHLATPKSKQNQIAP